MLIKAFRLDQVDNVEFIGLFFSCIGNAEVKPLRKRYYGPMIKFKLKIVLKIAYLGCFVEVARLESGVKNESGIGWCFQKQEIR